MANLLTRPPCLACAHWGPTWRSVDEIEETIYCHSEPRKDFTCFDPADVPPGLDVKGYFGDAGDNAI